VPSRWTSWSRYQPLESTLIAPSSIESSVRLVTVVASSAVSFSNHRFDRLCRRWSVCAAMESACSARIAARPSNGPMSWPSRPMRRLMRASSAKQEAIRSGSASS
jgi:hypothetical protein